MTLIIILLIIAAGLQVGIFLYSRNLKKKWKKEDVLLKYDIKSRSELFATLNRQDIPEEDVIKLNDIYSGQED
ncbi:hypothetical protein SAMN04488029_3467 [Reichenbachiella faecimaris]|uniref:Uncharacterized protein n=1 Tax=Reichenbachiella faecimaris TaxID=692418 RepID=A0A1W2GMA9_REIFA|nr:hypothetical protein [Reichenbachiella faecimaris]SMD37810.1 hypothetical protein SAMN04488029_3467 [Reichenbachiella faecimaris]